jgi:hypothetical protein
VEDQQQRQVQPRPGINEPNPYFKRFGQNSERIIVNELLDGHERLLLGH